MTEFVENKDGEWEKQDCERLMKRLKAMFPKLRICISGDSLYACKPFFQACEEYHWRYIVRCVPSVFEEYEALRKLMKCPPQRMRSLRHWRTGSN